MKVRLYFGSHKNPVEGTCVMEVCSIISGEEFSDFPDCVEKAVALSAQLANDTMEDDERQVLVALIPDILRAAPLPFLLDAPHGLLKRDDAHVRMAYYRYPLCTSYAGLIRVLNHHERLLNYSHRAKAMSMHFRGIVAPENTGSLTMTEPSYR